MTMLPVRMTCPHCGHCQSHPCSAQYPVWASDTEMLARESCTYHPVLICLPLTRVTSSRSMKESSRGME